MKLANTTMAEQDAPEYTSSTTLEDLPYLALMKICSYLDPKTLVACSRTCSTLNSVVRSGPLWKVLCPNFWARGVWTWNPEDPHVIPLIYHELPPDSGKTFRTDSFKCYYDPWHVLDYTFLSRMLSGLTPAVGPSVRELYMGQSEAVNDVLLRVALVQCPNLEVLSIKKSKITDDAFTLLPAYNACRKLRRLDLSESRVGDGAMAALAACWAPPGAVDAGPLVEEQPDAFRIPFVDLKWRAQKLKMYVDYKHSDRREEVGMIQTAPVTTWRGGEKGAVAGARRLNLASCGRLTDAGLFALMESRALVDNLEWLDLSGTGVTGEALSRFVGQCAKLEPENLFYCDHIDGPYQREANGCSNLQGCHCCVYPEF